MFLSISQLFFHIGSVSNRVWNLVSQVDHRCLNFTPPAGSAVEQSFWIVPIEVQVFTPSLAMLGHNDIPQPNSIKKYTDWSSPRSYALALHPVVGPLKNLAK